jgi:hypothetical protein
VRQDKPEWMKRPAVTWGWLDRWAADNGMPGTAVVVGQDHRPLHVQEIIKGSMILEAGTEEVTLDQLRATEGLTPEHRVLQCKLTDIFRIVDQGDSVDDDGQPVYVLQTRWG